MRQADVVIVGAGLAGLYAATTLVKHGVSCCVLEANDRLGGRILGNPTNEHETYQYDLGPTWIFPHQQKIQRLAVELGLDIFNQYIQGDALFQRAGATQPERFSGAGGMTLFRVKGGTYTLVHALSKRIDKQDILLNHTVDSMTLQDGVWQLSVNVNDQSTSFKARHVMLALPPRLIATGLVADSWASPSLISALKACQTWMSAQAKCLISYDRPFWRERDLSGQAFSQVGPMLEMHDASLEEHGSYALFGFIGWPVSKRRQYSYDVLKQKCLEQLVWFYGEEAQDFSQCVIKDWATDSRVASPLDVNEASQHPHFPSQLFTQELEALNLYLAGSEFAQIDPGYLEGALDSVDLSMNKLLLNLHNG